VLPDDEAWSNNYVIVRFPERPTAATVDVSRSCNIANGRTHPRLPPPPDLLERYYDQSEMMNNSLWSSTCLETIR
jgi:hypothetical protein